MKTLFAVIYHASKRQLALALFLSLATLTAVLVMVEASPGPCMTVGP